jgi:sugar phosphate isomerase/epimerase
MRLSLSTLGCPELSLREAAELAARTGYTGLELRSGPGATVEVGASASDRATWRRELSGAGVAPVSIASYVRVCAAGDDDAVVAAGLAEVRLAHDLGASWVRVFPGAPRDVPVDSEADRRGGRRLAAILSASAGLGVRLAVETHDSHPTARDVMRLLTGAQPVGGESRGSLEDPGQVGDRDGPRGDTADCGPVGVIWDALHTWLRGESPAQTAARLGPRLAYLQVKDVASRDDLRPQPLGAGVLPLSECLAAVRQGAVCDWVSWEYERMWHPEVPELAAVAGPGQRWLTQASSEDS